MADVERHPAIVATEEAQESTGRESGQSYLNASLWTRFDQAATLEDAAAAWLAIECERIGSVKQGVVVMGAPETGPFLPIAMWPEGAEISRDLSDAAEFALDEGRGIIHQSRAAPAPGAPDLNEVAYPLLVEGRMCGVAAVSITRRGEVELRAVMRELQWGSGWLELLARERSFVPKNRLSMVLELVAVCHAHEHATAAATALATELANRLPCERASVGFLEGAHVRVRALSHSAEFGKKSSLVAAISAAMEEAIGQQETLLFPARECVPQVLRAHSELAGYSGSGTVCTVPFGLAGKIFGAMTLERASSTAPFDEESVALCQHVAAMTGPLLENKRREDRWLPRRIWDSFHQLLGRLLGSGHLLLKLTSLVLCGLALFLFIATDDYRVSANATLEGSVQRALVAPIAGFVAEANVRAGDLVVQGQLLTRLDDRDLKLERLKLIGEREQYRRALRKAQASYQRTEVMILEAQIDQADAQIALLDAQLARVQLHAPFAGVVVSGDLSQSLGSPVERGAVLFEIAPLDSYRVILSVDERDVAEIAPQQRGVLALAGLPSEHLELVLERVTPVAAVSDGRNQFRVEARLQNTAAALRPGMQGVAKILVGHQRLAWIWSHRLLDWLRLTVWNWWP